MLAADLRAVAAVQHLLGVAQSPLGLKLQLLSAIGHVLLNLALNGQVSACLTIAAARIVPQVRLA